MSTPDWIAFKDREPTQADLPVVALDHNGEHFVFKRIQCTPGWHKAWVWWKPIGEPKPQPRLVLRHHDGREEGIAEPVYAFPSNGETQSGDEFFAGNKWYKMSAGVAIEANDSGTLRRRIA